MPIGSPIFGAGISNGKIRLRFSTIKSVYLNKASAPKLKTREIITPALEYFVSRKRSINSAQK